MSDITKRPYEQMNREIYQALYKKATSTPELMSWGDIYQLATVEPVVYAFINQWSGSNHDKPIIACICILAAQLQATRDSLIECYEKRVSA